MKYSITSGESEFQIDIDRQGLIRVEDEVVQADLRQIGETPFYSLLLAKRSFELRVEQEEEFYRIQIDGLTYEVALKDQRARLLAGVRSAAAINTGEIAIKSPMPGMIIDLPVQAGDPVEAGQLLVVVESMKMHNEFSAPHSGKVKSVRVKVGDRVLQNTILLTIAGES